MTNQLKNTILVTGVAGFIGSHLTERLLAEGNQVIGLDNFDPFYEKSIKERNLQSASASDDFIFYEADLLDPISLDQIFEVNEIDVIVHLAAKAGVRPSIEDPVGYQKVNNEGTVNLLEQCRIHDVKKFVFASSSSVYGNNKKVPFSETDSVDFPISPYAATKKAGELICYNYHHLYDINVFALRFFTVYGPRQRPEMAIHKFTRMIDSGEEIPVYGNGKPERDFTYIEDIIQGVCAAIEKVSGYEIINLGESDTISVNNLIRLIEKHLGKKARKNMMPMQPGDVDKTFADISRARELLAYNPATDIDTGIQQFVNWYKNMQ